MDMIVRFYKRNSLIVVLSLFIFSIFTIGIYGEFPINDDWIFKRQVDAFLSDQYIISELIDPTFIFQGGLGYLWSQVSGSSFSSLRQLTMFHYLFLMLGVYKIVSYFKISESLKFLSYVLIGFNPLIFFSSFTFMTEIYFLSYSVWAIYFYLQYFHTRNHNKLIPAFLLTGLVLLIRQLGIVLLISFLITEFYMYLRNKTLVSKRSLLYIFLGIFINSLSFGIWYYWPRYMHLANVGVIKGVIEPQFFVERLLTLWMALPYLGYFFLPLSLYKIVRIRSNKILGLLLGGSLIIGYVYYYFDVFPIGNVLYIENLLSKSNFQLNLSIFDNVVFKIFVAYLSALSSLYLVYFFVTNFIPSLKRKHGESLFLLLFSLGAFTSVLISSDYYDRYLLPTFISLLFYVVLTLKNEIELYIFRRSSFFVSIVTGIFVFLTFVHTYEFMTHTRIRWTLARELQDATGLQTQIYVDSTFGKYNNALKNNDFTGLNSGDPSSDYKCFVDQYTLDTDSKLLAVSTTVDEFLDNYLSKPRIYQSKKKRDIPKIKNNLDQLITNVEYTSITYNLIGKRSYVGSFCVDDEE